jgi:hypothetical protein
MPGIGWEKCEPLKELILITSPSKSKEEKEMNEGAVEKAQSPSLTVTKYKSMFHQGGSMFVYSWINDEHGDNGLQEDIKETKYLFESLS